VNRRPRKTLWFCGGVVLTVLGLASFALSAFVHSSIVNGLTSVTLPGALLMVYGWRGSYR
jgi:hypothetical protein